MMRINKETVMVAMGTGGALVVTGLIIRNMNFRRYSPKPNNENHIFRTEVGDEYADTINYDLRSKESKFAEREFKRYSE